MSYGTGISHCRVVCGAPYRIVDRQAFDPLLAWLRDAYDLPDGGLKVSYGVGVEKHPAAAVAAVADALARLGPWQQVATLSATQACKSLVLPLAMLHGRIAPGACADLSRLDGEAQIDEWGLVEGSHDVDRAFTAQAVGAAGSLLGLLRAPDAPLAPALDAVADA